MPTASRGSFYIRTIWNESILANSSKTNFELREFFIDTEYAVLADLVLSPFGQAGISYNVTMCRVEAHWVTVDMWILSSAVGTVTSNSTWDATSITSKHMEDSVFPIARIRRRWTDSLNAASSNSSAVLADLINGALQILQKQTAPIGAPVDAQVRVLFYGCC